MSTELLEIIKNPGVIVFITGFVGVMTYIFKSGYLQENPTCVLTLEVLRVQWLS